MRRVLAALVMAAGCAQAAELSAAEQKMVQYVDANAVESNRLLQKLVDINSGTFNAEGVRKVAAVLRPEFEALGFKLRWIPMDEVHRAGHLVAERTGTHGKRVLLIGHMDTVFEPASPFQKYEPKGDTAI